MKIMLEQERIRHGWTQEYVGQQIGITAEAARVWVQEKELSICKSNI